MIFLIFVCFTVLYKDYIIPNNISENTNFLQYEFTDVLLRALGIDQEYAFSDQLTEKYWHKEQIGNLTAMTAGAVDVSGIPYLTSLPLSYELMLQFILPFKSFDLRSFFFGIFLEDQVLQEILIRMLLKMSFFDNCNMREFMK